MLEVMPSMLEILSSCWFSGRHVSQEAAMLEKMPVMLNMTILKTNSKVKKLTGQL